MRPLWRIASRKSEGAPTCSFGGDQGTAWVAVFVKRRDQGGQTMNEGLVALTGRGVLVHSELRSTAQVRVPIGHSEQCRSGPMRGKSVSTDGGRPICHDRHRVADLKSRDRGLVPRAGYPARDRWAFWH